MTEPKKRIGLLTAFTPEIFKSEYHTRMMSGIVDALRQTPFDLELIMVRDKGDVMPSEEILKKHNLDGLLFLTWRMHETYMKEAQIGSDLPIVMINDYAASLKANMVYCDNEAGIRLSLQHISNRGYKKIGVLHGPTDASNDAKERFEKCKEMLSEFDLTLADEHYRACEYFFEEDGYLKMLDIIQNTKALPRVMLCFNDELAIGALKALKESWVSVPGQVAVMGYDGIEKGKYVNPPLTTVRQPLEKMGGEMASILVGLIEGKLKSPVQKKFPPDLVLRESC